MKMGLWALLEALWNGAKKRGPRNFGNGQKHRATLVEWFRSWLRHLLGRFFMCMMLLPQRERRSASY